MQRYWVESRQRLLINLLKSNWNWVMHMDDPILWKCAVMYTWCSWNIALSIGNCYGGICHKAVEATSYLIFLWSTVSLQGHAATRVQAVASPFYLHNLLIKAWKGETLQLQASKTKAPAPSTFLHPGCHFNNTTTL